MSAFASLIATRIQTIQHYISTISAKENCSQEINSIADLLNHPLRILEQTGKLIDLSSHPNVLWTAIDLLLSLLESYGGYLYAQPDNKGWKTIRKDWHLLNEQVERLRRYVDLIRPKTEQDFIGAIKWMTENGSDEDLDILEIANQELPDLNKEMRDLMEYCQQRLGKTLEQTNSALGQDTFDINALLNELRGKDNNGSLKYLIHGWGAPSANKFFEICHSLASEHQKDSNCLIKTNGTYTFKEMQEDSKLVILDLGIKEDSLFYSHTKRDLIFFPASERNESILITSWQNRARAVVIDGSGFYARTLINVGKENGLPVYIWDGGNMVIYRGV